ncbi:NAD(P)H-hydrate dehydratase [Agarivorans sp. QJM3NY_33]|uniref:NAD(P)H-hydrate dehydratase n=1 Tax=Agarivorans sp. QJM3NY_33 TaxID=3421432 RepID=UPI003D7CC124
MGQKHGLFTASLPQSLWSAEAVKAQEAVLAIKQGLSLFTLMERAGQAAFAFLQHRWPNARRLLVFAGGGNNGGDAYVLARLAKQAYLQIQLIELGLAERLPEEARLARQAWLAVGGTLDSMAAFEGPCDVIVDGIFGTGLAGEIREPIAGLLTKINQLSAPVLALDLPSGLCANTGRIFGVALKASATISFVGLKQGLFTGQSADYVGDLVFAGLGIGDDFSQMNRSRVERNLPAPLWTLLAKRSRVAHKGQCGRLALLGGNLGMPGAIRLAAEASLRTGAGLVNVLTKPEHLALMLAGRPELMVMGVELEQRLLLKDLLAKANSLVVGPGLAQDRWAGFLWTEALARKCNLLVDADALNLLAQQPERRDNWVLTPHPGEAARLLQCSVLEVEQDRIAAALKIQQRFGGVCVLKGAGTIIAGDGKKVKISTFGNPGMASGGMGDVLSGIIGGLIAQLSGQYGLFDIACLGVSIHGMAADFVAEQGERGMLASDLMPYIRQLVNPNSNENLAN